MVAEQALELRLHKKTYAPLFLRPPSARGIVRRRYPDPVGQTVRARPVVAEDGVRNRRCWRMAIPGIDHRRHAVGDQHLDRGHQRRGRQRVGVDPDKQRVVDAARVAINADRLRNREDVRLVEGIVEGRATVSRRSETDALGG